MSSPKSVAPPEVGDVTVTTSDHLHFDTAEYPWLQDPEVDVPVVGVALADGTEFLYGSLISFNNTVRKIAGKVPESESVNAQSHLFTALPDVLKGGRYLGVSKVERIGTQGKMLLSASRNITRAARLIFAVERVEDPSQPPAVLRVGISVPNDHSKLMRSLGINVIGRGGPKKIRGA